MLSKPQCYTLLLLLIGINVLYGQERYSEGYIITNDLDSISGYLYDRGDILNAKKCCFVEAPGSEERFLGTDEICEYRFVNGKYYVSDYLWMDSLYQKVFLEFIVEGKANLFYYRDTDGPHYYIRKDDGSLLELKEERVVKNVDGMRVQVESTKHIGLLKAYFSDCDEIQNDIDHVKLNHHSLIELTSSYHDMVCPDYRCEVYVKKPEKIRLFIYPVLGFRHSEYIGASTYLTIDQHIFKHNGLVYGFNSGMHLPFLNENFSLELNTLFGNQYYYHYYIQEIYPSSKEHYYYHLNSYYNETGLFLKRAFSNKNIRPLIGAGGILHSGIFLKNKMVVDRENQESIVYSEYELNEFPAMQYGYCLLTGINTKIRENDYFILELKYNRIYKYESYFIKSMWNINLNIGWRF